MPNDSFGRLGWYDTVSSPILFPGDVIPESSSIGETELFLDDGGNFLFAQTAFTQIFNGIIEKLIKNLLGYLRSSLHISLNIKPKGPKKSSTKIIRY